MLITIATICNNSSISLGIFPSVYALNELEIETKERIVTMIERIRGIKVQGRCFPSAESFVLYPKPSDRIALVYGKNGSGKSTISEAFASIANNSFSEGITSSVIDA